ncbi:unnamed protein product [Thlaspi arvense]|uniref:Uncharacterized protein n=1 Tax=Thlaspi arvense TaxID=13288 RepID=A0AAU9S249_THLAR|nr:unnamed protein product [Thlaspi arvense]
MTTGLSLSKLKHNFFLTTSQWRRRLHLLPLLSLLSMLESNLVTKKIVFLSNELVKVLLSLKVLERDSSIRTSIEISYGNLEISDELKEYTYDRDCKWLEGGNSTCPKKQEMLTSDNVTPKYALKKSYRSMM